MASFGYGSCLVERSGRYLTDRGENQEIMPGFVPALSTLLTLSFSYRAGIP